MRFCPCLPVRAQIVFSFAFQYFEHIATYLILTLTCLSVTGSCTFKFSNPDYLFNVLLISLSKCIAPGEWRVKRTKTVTETMWLSALLPSRALCLSSKWYFRSWTFLTKSAIGMWKELSADLSEEMALMPPQGGVVSCPHLARFKATEGKSGQINWAFCNTDNNL